MKQFIKKIAAAVSVIAIFIPIAVRAQDVDINILMTPASIAQNGTSQIQVDICNNDPGSVAVPSYKLRPFISVPSTYLLITGVTGLPAGWSVCSNTGSVIRFSNGTDNFLPGECRTFYIDVKGVGQTGGVSTITANMSFGGGAVATACNAGPQTVGNLVANDASTSGFEVIGVLPLTLLSFKADIDNCKTTLKWETAVENNTDKFIVEESADGNNFSFVTAIAAAGYSSKILTYQAPVQQSKGTSFYRLKMLDKDGSGTYSNTIKVSNPCGAGNKISLYPNPAKDQVTLQFPDTRQRLLTLTDASGRQVLKQMLKPSNIQTIDVRKLGQGVYTVFVQEMDGQTSFTTKLIRL